MRFSKRWLDERFDSGLSTSELADALTMAGLEVDGVEPAGPPLDGVLSARVVHLEPHGAADSLKVCQADTGAGDSVTVVCGADNVRTDMMACLVTPGTSLPDGRTVAVTNIRGVTSHGMLASAAELGLGDDDRGLLELPGSAPVGAQLAELLGLDDAVIEVDLTPNRGDCLSIEGMARELAAITRRPLPMIESVTVPPQDSDRITVHVATPEACPRYLGRIITDIDATASSPLWLTERLRRSGVRPVSLVVDITNYVMLELGQPLHAFDRQRIAGDIAVRWARPDESVTLLGGQSLSCRGDELVIADTRQVLALAGVMGGAEAAVTETTGTVFLESAHFTPVAIAGRARRYGLHTDASHRFERGVDPTLPRRALERASQLLEAIGGGRCGPVIESGRGGGDDPPRVIELARATLDQRLGLALGDGVVHEIFDGLGVRYEYRPAGWQVEVPSHRFDWEHEVDLVEEVARLYGYNRLPMHAPTVPEVVSPPAETHNSATAMRRYLVEAGYHEAITYSFVDSAWHEALQPQEAEAVTLRNPLSADLAVMRTSTWVGLLRAVARNLNRQQERIRLFELGRRFEWDHGGVREHPVLGGVATGARTPEHWDVRPAPVDFFDVKGDLERLFHGLGRSEALVFQPATHPALHAGQTARVLLGGVASETPQAIGWLGRIHPRLAEQLDLPDAIYLFELATQDLGIHPLPVYRDLSRYPSVRRDIAVRVETGVSAAELLRTSRLPEEPRLREVRIFDVYRGAGIPEGSKSVALGLIFQDVARTLTDREVDELVVSVVDRLRSRLGATLRE